MLIAKKKKERKKANKQACKGKESFFQVDVIYGYRLVMYRTLCQQLAQVTQAFFFFFNITEIITLRSSSLEPLSKYTCIRLSQKRAERQKNNFGKYLIKNRIFLILVLNIKLFPFKIYRGIIHCDWARGLIVNNPVYPCLPQEYCIPCIPLFSKIQLVVYCQCCILIG